MATRKTQTKQRPITRCHHCGHVLDWSSEREWFHADTGSHYCPVTGKWGVPA